MRIRLELVKRCCRRRAKLNIMMPRGIRLQRRHPDTACVGRDLVKVSGPSSLFVWYCLICKRDEIKHHVIDRYRQIHGQQGCFRGFLPGASNVDTHYVYLGPHVVVLAVGAQSATATALCHVGQKPLDIASVGVHLLTGMQTENGHARRLFSAPLSTSSTCETVHLRPSKIACEGSDKVARLRRGSVSHVMTERWQD